MEQAKGAQHPLPILSLSAECPEPTPHLPRVLWLQIRSAHLPSGDDVNLPDGPFKQQIAILTLSIIAEHLIVLAGSSQTPVASVSCTFFFLCNLY